MNAHYRLFVKSVIKLAATLIIKSDYTARSINEYLSLTGKAVDADDPRTWKYYLNLAGQYHSSDTVMQIRSLDDLSVIDFTIENLRIHRGTKKAYAYGSNYYRELVEAYPKQQSLINGILNPIDLDDAIAAEDHKILFYDTTLVEAQEQNLIPGLQKFIDNYFVRWDNTDYALFEPYYYPGLLGVMYTKLPVEIMLLRKQACKTNHAHSFHIRQYLTSFSTVGDEVDFMTLKQRLYLYRNIHYLNRNLGREETFRDVVQKILTDRGFSLVGYDFAHDYNGLDEKLVPNIEMFRTPINHISPAQGGESKSVGDILDMEAQLAPDNFIYRDDAEREATFQMQKSLFNDLPSKVLESNVLDRTDAEPYGLSGVLLNHWIYLSHFGRYTTVVSFSNPANGDTYSLTAKNAFILYLYAYNKAIGVDLERVPTISAQRVRRIPLPTKEELKALVQSKKVPDYYIDYILDTQAYIDRYVSVEAFKEACQEIQQVMVSHREMRHFNNDYIAEGQLHTIIDRCYMDIEIDLGNGISYAEWLTEMGIDTTLMGRVEYGLIAKSILNIATGVDTTLVNSARAIHAAMIRIMGALSSYTVQYLAEINDTPLKTTDMKFPKLTIPESLEVEHTDVETPAPTVIELTGHVVAKHSIGTGVQTSSLTVTDERSILPIRVAANIKQIGSGEVVQTIETPMPISRLLPPPELDLSTITEQSVAGYEDIDPLPLSDLVTSMTLVGYEALTDARRKLFLGI